MHPEKRNTPASAIPVPLTSTDGMAKAIETINSSDMGGYYQELWRPHVRTAHLLSESSSLHLIGLT